jgi:hypothetical protein
LLRYDSIAIRSGFSDAGLSTDLATANLTTQ